MPRRRRTDPCTLPMPMRTPRRPNDPDGADERPKKPDLPAKVGVNRFAWDLCYAGAEMIPARQGRRRRSRNRTAGEREPTR